MTPPTIDQLLHDPDLSQWMRRALEAAQTRDPIQSVIEAERLLSALTARGPTAAQLLLDPSVSSWARDALRDAMKGDTVRSMIEAELLLAVLERHAGQALYNLQIMARTRGG